MTKDQGVTHRLDRCRVLYQAEKPGAVGGVAVKDSADQPVALDHQPFVDATTGVAKNDILTIGTIGKVARAEQIAAGDLELGRRLHRAKGGGYG